jgi:protein phosphatase
MLNASCRPSVRAATATDIGRVRRENQDAVLLDDKQGLFLLADGMGGGPAGALAARLSVERFPIVLEHELDANRRQGSASDQTISVALNRSLAVLSTEVRQRGDADPALIGMGAAVVVLVLNGDRAYVANLGDSRAYLLRDNQLQQLTADHNLAALLVRLQEIRPEDFATHPARNRLTQYVGMDGEVEPDSQKLVLKQGDRLLLCSDGLTGMLDDAAILRILGRTTDTTKACEALVAAANDAGGRDNISVMVVDVDSTPASGAREG